MNKKREISDRQSTLGILMLQNMTSDILGSVDVAASFDYPVRFLQVPGAWADNVTKGDQKIIDAYLKCARELEREGCAAITTDCGFTSLFQTPLSAAVSIPVATSSLLLVPLVVRIIPPGAKVAVITFDADRLTEEHCQGAGWSLTNTAVVVAGIEGSTSWSEMLKPEGTVVRDILEDDVLSVIRHLLSEASSIRAIVLECTAFPIVTERVCTVTNLPIFDFMNLVNLLMASIPGATIIE